MHKLVAILFFFIFSFAKSQSTDSSFISHQSDTTYSAAKDEVYLISNIKISGNKKTKDVIILRELLFKQGDYIKASELPRKLQRSKELIFNTTLFLNDTVYVSEKRGNLLLINIDVKERWYLFPLPYFALADRNFNTWWVQENHDFSRINYGLKLIHNNFSGYNDRLSVWLINGYTQQVALRYNLPYLDKALTQGINVGFTYAHQREINFETDSTNKQVFLKTPDDFIRTVVRFDATYSYRPNINTRHYFKITYTKESIADTVLKLNPLFYPQNRTSINYIDFTYLLQYYNMDYNAYPTKGYFGETYIYKRGVNALTNLWQIGVHGIYVKPLLKNTFFNTEAAATIKFPDNEYYFNQGLFGYGYYTLRGMEYYVVDGSAGALAKFTLQQHLFNYNAQTYLRSKNYNKVPFKFYFKIYSDWGYAYNKYINNNNFNNKIMYTYGAGLDVVSIYDMVFRFEYSINQLGNRGLFIHFRSNF